jgi:hypothetical protein
MAKRAQVKIKTCECLFCEIFFIFAMFYHYYTLKCV